MRITPEVLEAMECKKIAENHYLLWGSGHPIVKQKDSEHTWSYYPTQPDKDGNPKGNHFHCATDIEELIGFAWDEGYQEGKDDLRRDLKELLKVGGR